MPLITFSSPQYKDKTVYAVAGSFTETVLKIARTNKIPIDFSCENGECGTCVIKVTQLGDKTPMGLHMEEKEKKILLELGKVTKEELDDLTTNDQPSQWRLACQFIPRDEDILVEY
ncbi:2Fe-2S iron-sulfur cluster-binding protein [Candidatus Thiothrix sp. Deng01]|uniref:2Fe-2S iron-sulfur cluster-binding protein n=1 Tax=Candidatus Thiothrix phosphatis TaxID=3112415 RepID=A0ABU6CZT0_9GAMM|nr:2Fe-2S iron-sulfur cluster-binding protein [Candidatus Thiothrix sp. Deng01]MEB4592348.1 2Fe-2S iron-sulfur cluster-binding protein [Candidatus Thiothrix sp. Deng01]